MQGKNKQKGLFLIKVWLGEPDFSRMAALAEKLGFRRVGLPLKTIKPHGFSDEWRANTNGISQTFKHLADYYEQTEAYRLNEAARIANERAALDHEAQEKGLLHLLAPGPTTRGAQNKKPPEGGGMG